MVMRKEFMQWWIQQTNSCRQSFKGLENTFKILTLIREQLIKSFLTIIHLVSKDHFTHGIDSVTFKEHVFGAGQTNTTGSKRNSVLCLFRGISIGTNTQFGYFFTPSHELREIPEGFTLFGIQCLLNQNLNDF